MESRAYALITGVFVLGLLACTVLWAHWLAKTPLARTSYRVVSTVAVSGLNPEAQVRYRGMGVGRVSTIGLDPKDPRRILIGIEVNNDIPITRGTYAQLGMEGITGISYVHLLDDYKDMQAAQKKESGLAELPLKPSFMDTLSDGADGAMQDARTLMTNVNGLLTPENKQRINATLASLEKVTASLEVTAAKLPATLARADAFLSEENRRAVSGSLAQINETTRSLPEISREAQLLVKDGRAMVESFNKLLLKADSALASVDGVATTAQGAVGGMRDDTLPRVNTLAESVERTSQRFGRLALQLDREPQSAIFGRKPGRPGPGEPGFQ